MMPANELSIFVSATQNKKAGKKLPSNPDARISISRAFGNFLICFNAVGSKTIPALNIRRAATWYALNVFKPIFIRIKELPHINDNARKIPQFIMRPCAAIGQQR